MSSTAIVCDDHPMFRSGVVHCLNETTDFRVVAEAATVASAMAKLQLYQPDVVVTDLAMPDRSGFELLTWIQQNMPAIRTVVLSMHTELALVQKARSLGAVGFLAKEDAEHDLLIALRQPSADFYTSQSIGNALLPQALEHPHHGPALDLRHVSKAELRVLAMLAKSMTSREIAEQLNISVRTVEAHRYRLAEKLNAKGPNKLLELAILHRLQLTG